MSKLINRLYKQKAINSLDECQEVMELAFLLKKQDSQSYLAWEDALNKISTMR